MATTLMGVAIDPSEAGYDLSIAAVGDSELWIMKRGEWRPHKFTEAEDELVHTGGTKALPAKDPALAMATRSILDGALFLMTDGVGTPLIMNTQVQSQLSRWWSKPPDPFTFAQQVAFARRTFVDDRTVVGVWLPPVDVPESDSSADVCDEAVD